jgi:hypothetical protein
MLMDWVVWSPDKASQERSWPHSERWCVTLWAIGTILSSGHEGNEFLSTHPLLRCKASCFIKDECGSKTIHPKHPIEVQMIWNVIVTSTRHQSKSRNKM